MKSRLCRFSILRYVPNENREEFINIGLLFHSPEDGYVNLGLTKNFSRVSFFDDEMDINFLKIVLDGVQKDFTLSFTDGPSSEVFEWNYLEKATSIYVNQLQFSPIRAIRTENYLLDEENLFRTFVYFDVHKNYRITEDEVKSIMNRVFRQNNVFQIVNRNINIDLGNEEIKIDYCLNNIQEDKTKFIKTLSFDYSRKNMNKATQLAKEWVWNYSKITNGESIKDCSLKEVLSIKDFEITTLVYFKESNKNVKTALNILSEFSNIVEARNKKSIENFATDLINDLQLSISDLDRVE
jgi:hypothetical protein